MGGVVWFLGGGAQMTYHSFDEKSYFQKSYFQKSMKIIFKIIENQINNTIKVNLI